MAVHLQLINNNLDLSLLFERTAVCRPYFAFSRIWRTNNGIAAIFEPEHPMEHEVGLIAAAEAGRHLAILGACAASLVASDGKQYYLATQARLCRTEFWQGDPCQLEAEALVVNSTRRGVTTIAQLSAGKPIFTLDCSYQILPDRLFERLFDRYRIQSKFTPTASPYRENIRFGDISFTDTGLFTTCGPLSPIACAGHFPSFPAWPIAVIMHSLSRLAGLLLHRIIGRECNYSVVQAEVSADHLAFAVEPLVLSITYNPVNSNPPVYHFHCTASLHDKTVGLMQLILASCN